MLRVDAADRTRLIDPLFRAGPAFWLTVLPLVGVFAWGVRMYLGQLDLGLVTTGMDRPAYWGIYIVNFIFLIGVSMAGTLITAVLHLTGANWRRPITRIAEATTVCGLLVAGIQILIDMGRPDRMLSMFRYGRLQSPLIWDMASLSLYLLASMFALYLSLLPDIAIVRDNLPATAPGWRRTFYRLASLGWRGNREQWRRFERTVRVLSILVIPIGITLHTVTSWILSTTMQAGWHSTILAPYFVVGAIFSGIALVFILLTLMRTNPAIGHYVGEKQYRNLGWLFMIMGFVWFYFTYAEHLTMAAGQEESEFPVLLSKLWGSDAPAFWGMVGLMLVAVAILVLPHLIPARWMQVPVFKPRFAAVSSLGAAAVLALAYLPVARPITASLIPAGQPLPLTILALSLMLLAGMGALVWLKRHLTLATVIAGIAVVAGMWLERWSIIVPSLTHPRLVAWSSYTPTPTEWALTAASVALFALLLMVFFKLFPAVSIWEIAEGRAIDKVESPR